MIRVIDPMEVLLLKSLPARFRAYCPIQHSLVEFEDRHDQSCSRSFTRFEVFLNLHLCDISL